MVEMIDFHLLYHSRVLQLRFFFSLLTLFLTLSKGYATTAIKVHITQTSRFLVLWVFALILMFSFSDT